MPEGLRKGCSANQTELYAPERLTQKTQKETPLTLFQIHMDVLTQKYAFRRHWAKILNKQHAVGYFLL
jgi:hypothetical protein